MVARPKSQIRLLMHKAIPESSCLGIFDFALICFLEGKNYQPDTQYWKKKKKKGRNGRPPKLFCPLEPVASKRKMPVPSIYAS